MLKKSEQVLILQGCDYVIALTHMVWPFDEQLAKEVEEIDIVLAGHDHDYGKKCVSSLNFGIIFTTGNMY